MLEQDEADPDLPAVEALRARLNQLTVDLDEAMGDAEKAKREREEARGSVKGERGFGFRMAKYAAGSIERAGSDADERSAKGGSRPGTSGEEWEAVQQAKADERRRKEEDRRR